MRRIMACISFCLLGLAATITVLAGPASAAVPGLQIVSATSATNSISPKRALATCPAGKVVVGTGAELTGGLGDVVIDDLVPMATTVRAVAYENGNSPRNWNVRAYAICANPLPGLQIVTATSLFNSNNKSVTATCPAGKNTIGTGAELTGARGDVVIDFLRPTATTVIAGGTEIGNSPRNWNVRAYAICANPLPGLEIVTKGSAINSDNKFATAICPAGKVVTGAGAEIGGAVNGVVIDDLRPTATTVTATAFEHGNVAPNWFILAYAICATR
jgi:hypothetical protein